MLASQHCQGRDNKDKIKIKVGWNISQHIHGAADAEVTKRVSTPWVGKKQDTKLLAITSLTIIQFSKKFY